MTRAHAAVFCFPDLHASLLQGLLLVVVSNGHVEADGPGDGDGALQGPGTLGTGAGAAAGAGPGAGARDLTIMVQPSSIGCSLHHDTTNSTHFIELSP